MKKFFDKALQLWKTSLPGRIWNRYSEKEGNVLAAGMSFSALFSIFAAFWIAISVFGFILSSREALWEQTIILVNTWIPGLIKEGPNDGGIIDPNIVHQSFSVFSWTGIIAILVLYFTALGWLGATRSSITAIVDNPLKFSNVLMTKLIDTGTMLVMGLLILIIASLSVLSSNAAPLLEEVFPLFIDLEISTVFVTIGGLILNLLFNLTVVVVLFKAVAQVRLSVRKIWLPLVFGAVALTVIQSLGSLLLGGATRNPLLATFAVFIGLLIWFNLISRIILITAAWVGEIRKPSLIEFTEEANVTP